MNQRILEKLEWGLDVCLLSLPVALTFSRALVEILLALVIVHWILIHFLKRQNLFIKCPIIFPILSFLVVGVLSVAHSKFLFKSLEELLNLIEYSLLALIAFERFSNPHKLNQLVQVIIYSALLVGIDGFIQLFMGYDLIRMRPPFEVQGAMRLTASFSHPNNFGAYLATVIPIGLATAYQKRKWIHFVILPAWVVTLLLTYSRGAWLGLVFALIVFSCLKDKKLSLFIVLLIGISIFVLPDSLVQRAKEIFNFKNVTTQLRFGLWKDAWELFLQKPLMGHGLKSFSLLLEKGYVHNCYLQILFEMGLLGLLSFVWILFTFFWLVMRKGIPILGAGFGCAILAQSVHSMIDTNLYSTPIATLFWLVLGAGLAVHTTQISSSSSPADRKT